MGESFKKEMRKAENGIKKGYSERSGTWNSHPSVEGGTNTIAYGHKLQKGERLENITDAQAIELFNKDFAKAQNIARKKYNSIYGKGSFEKLEQYKQNIATDISFNLGSFNYIKLMKAMHDNNKEEMIQQSKTFYKKDGEMLLLKERHKMRVQEINNNWSADQPVGGVDLTYEIYKDQIIGFECSNETLNLIYNNDLNQLLNIKTSYLASALWVEYREEHSSTNIMFSLDPKGSVQKKSFYPECIKDVDLGHVLFKCDYIMKMFALNTKDNKSKSPMISPRLRSLGLKPAHEYDRNKNTHQSYSRFWLTHKNAKIIKKNGYFIVESIEIEVKAREQVIDTNGKRSDKEIQDTSNYAYQFAREFTRLYDEISKEYPVFGELKQVCKAIILAKYIKINKIPVDLEKVIDKISWKMCKSDTVDIIKNQITEQDRYKIMNTSISGGVDLSIIDYFSLLEFDDQCLPEEIKESYEISQKFIILPEFYKNHIRLPFLFGLRVNCIECQTPINPTLLILYYKIGSSNNEFLCKYHSNYTCKRCFKQINGRFYKIESLQYHPSCFTCYFCGEAIEGNYAKERDYYLHPSCKAPDPVINSEYGYSEDEMDSILLEILCINNRYQ